MSNTFDPNDPRLTDYVLGELDLAECAEIEQLLERSPEARAAVDELLEVSGLLAESLKAGTVPALLTDQRAAIDAAIQNAPKPAAAAISKRRSPARTVATLATVVVSAAAVWMVVLVLNRSNDAGVDQEVTHLARGVEAKPVNRTEIADASESDPARTTHYDFTHLTGKDSGAPVAVDEELKSQLRSERVNETGTTASGPASKDDSATVSSNNDSLGVQTFPEPKNWAPLSARHRGERTPSISSNGAALAPVESSPKHGRVVGMSRPGEFEARGAIAPTASPNPGQGKGTQDARYYDKAKTSSSGVMIIRDVKDGSSNSAQVGEAEVSALPVQDGQQIAVTGIATKALSPSGTVALETTEGPADTYFYGLNISGHAGREVQKNAEAYDAIIENSFFEPGKAPLSTFSIDVDTASYSNMRRFLSSGQQPPRDSVRIEELVNYFNYEDPAPTDGRPFAVRLEAASCPWATDHRLVRVSLKGKEIPKSERPPTNLVFLLDVSVEMRDANKLPLVKEAMKLLVSEMTEDDRIAIVTYAGNAGLVLDSTTGNKKDVIVKAIDSLQAAGSTNGEAGIHLAYSTAVAHLFPEGSNRVILCTDGDFNVGVSGDDELVGIIQEKARDSKVFLSVFGFGMGNLKDAKLEKLADKGNGHYAYVDNLREAKKVFVEDMTGTLYTIAKDVKLQLEFNPAKVGAYRLIGYENRVMPAEHFNDDTKDAGEIGAGHTVAALYELIPADKMAVAAKRPDLRYQELPQAKDEPKSELKHGEELLTVSLRYKHPDGNKSDKLEFPLVDKPGEASQGSRDMRWTMAVAAFGMLLRGSQYRGQASFDMVLELAQAGRGDDKTGRRAEFIELAKTAKSLYTPQATVPPSTPPVDPKIPQ